jgi:hypothetical protein
MEFAAVAVRSARVWPEITEHADSRPRRWQPSHVSHSVISPGQHNDLCLLIYLSYWSLVIYLRARYFTLCPFVISTNHLEPALPSTTSLFIDAFIIHIFSFHPVLSFPIGLSHLSTYTQRAPT